MPLTGEDFHEVVERARQGRRTTITDGAKPVAVVLNPEELEALQKCMEEYRAALTAGTLGVVDHKEARRRLGL